MPFAQVAEFNHEAIRLNRAESAIGRHDEPGRRMSRIEFAIDDLVAHGGPADFAMQFHVEAEPREQAKRLGHDERRAIRERDEADAQRMRAMVFAQRWIQFSDAPRT